MLSGGAQLALLAKLENHFFLAFAAIAWVAIIMGFGPELHGQLTDQAPKIPLIVHIHAVVFTGWMALFTTQIWLIRKRRILTHRRLGLTAFVLIPVMVMLGIAAALVSRRAHFEAGQNEMLAYMIVPLTDMLLFPSFAVPALLFREDRDKHKRLILLATASLLPAAFGRWIGPSLLTHFGDGFFGMMIQTYLGSNLMIAAAVLLDLATKRRADATYLFGLPWMFAVQLATSAVYHSPGWVALARRAIGH
jgi:uncharacterized membrane protein YozB (DUF420 family)